MPSVIEWEALTLSNIADGKLEADFQSLLENVVAAFAEPLEQFEIGADGRVVYKLKGEIAFAKSTKTGGILVLTRMTETPPKRQAAGGELKMIGGKLQVEKAHQLSFGEGADDDPDPDARNQH